MIDKKGDPRIKEITLDDFKTSMRSFLDNRNLKSHFSYEIEQASCRLLQLYEQGAVTP